MKLAVIAPTNYFDLTKEYSDDCVLVLAHWLLKDKEYKEKVANLDVSCKILDNGAAEKQLVDDIDTLLTLADEINADEIVLPDVFMDSGASWSYVLRTYDKVIDAGFEPVIVLQGKTKRELEEYWVELYDNGYVGATIGLGNEVFLQAVKGRQPRNKFLYSMMSKYDFVFEYDIHYLGYSTLYDWIYAPTIVRSTDSGIFIKAASLGFMDIPFEHIKGHHLEPDMGFNKIVYDVAERMIIRMKDRIRRRV